MHGITIDDRPDSPVGTKQLRRAVAIHWNWTTEYSTKEIAQALGVRPQTIREYLSEGPSDEVRQMMDVAESEVRMIAVQELRHQLKAAGHRSRTAETPTEIWQDSNGDVRVKDVTDDDGELVKKVPVPQDIDLLPNEEARYYARAEVRDILDQLTNLLGVGEPEQVEVSGEGGGPIVIHTEADDGDD